MIKKRGTQNGRKRLEKPPLEPLCPPPTFVPSTTFKFSSHPQILHPDSLLRPQSSRLLPLQAVAGRPPSSHARLLPHTRASGLPVASALRWPDLCFSQSLRQNANNTSPLYCCNLFLQWGLQQVWRLSKKPDGPEPGERLQEMKHSGAQSAPERRG